MAENNVSILKGNYAIILPVLSLIALGLVLLLFAIGRHDPLPFYLLKKHTLFCFLGLALMLVSKNIPLSAYRKIAFPLLLISVGLLLFLIIAKWNAGGRVVHLSGLPIWVSWLAVFAIALYIPQFMASRGPIMESFFKGLLPCLIIGGVLIFLVHRLSLSGITLLLVGLIFTLLLLGGASRQQLFSICFLASIPFVWWLISTQYRLIRLWRFITPWAEYKWVGYGSISIFSIFSQAGILGVGIGNEKNSLLHLLNPYPDSVMAAIAQELGLCGVFAIILMFSVLIIRGIQITLTVRDLYAKYLSFSMTCLIGLQGVVNLLGFGGVLPAKGINFPLIAYGGCSMVFTLLCIGILLNISSMKQ